MKKSDVIFKNAIVLTMDEDYLIYNPGAVAVKGDSILAVGDEQKIIRGYEAPEVLPEAYLYPFLSSASSLNNPPVPSPTSKQPVSK